MPIQLAPTTPQRERILADASDEHAKRVLALLLAQDGSTTLLCETIAGGPVGVQVHHQQVTTDVPPLVREQLPGARFIERATSLIAHGQVLMDNLSFTALTGLEPDIEADLLAGVMPIGHLLSRLWVRRQRLQNGAELAARLWSVVGLPDSEATRTYRIDTPDAPRMLIAETYRRGMLMARH